MYQPAPFQAYAKKTIKKLSVSKVDKNGNTDVVLANGHIANGHVVNGHLANGTANGTADLRERKLA